MKKLLSVLLSLAVVFTCFVATPAIADGNTDTPVNLIVNGDGSAGTYTEEDKANSTYAGEFDKNAPIGWRDLSAQYSNAQILYPHTFDISETYSNYSKSPVLAVNSWQTLVQDIVLEAGKTYMVSAKLSLNAGNAAQNNRYLAIGIDAGSGMDAASLSASSAWYARKDLVFTETTKKDGVTSTTWTGDFTDHTFTFNADDFIKANNITVNEDGTFPARFALINNCTGYAIMDDVSIYEAVPVNAVVEKANGIQGGYITGDTAGVIGEDITFTAVAYKGNTFDGWYDADGKLLSTDATVTVTVSEGLTYVAKFDIENLWPDAGYENFPLGTSLLYTDGGDTKNPLWFSEQTSTFWHAIVTNERVTEGAQALKLTHRNNVVSTPVKVEKNKDYVLSFDWVIKTLTMGSGENEKPTYLSDIVIKDSVGITIADYALNTDNTGEFQNTEIFFNSEDNTDIIVAFRYYAGSDCIYLDNFSLTEGTPDDTYVKVTYDSGDASVGSFYEYVKAGTEYTVRQPRFKTPISKILLGYTLGSQTLAFSDVITVNEDTVLTAYYSDYVCNMLSDTTSFNPDDYDYTFALLPDEQRVNEVYPTYYDDIYQWVADNKDTYNIKGAISLGDITQAAAYTEWARAYEGYMLLEDAGIPFALTPGNHDYDFGISHGEPNDNTVRRTEYLNYFFNRNTVDYSEYTTCPVTGDSLVNSYYTIDGINEKYLIMALEIFPRDEVLEWANEVVAAHPNHRVIAATHSHIYSGGGYTEDHDDYPINYPEGSNSAEEVIEKFITKHENILMYLCGHSPRSDIYNIPITGDNGNTVYQLLIDQQNDDDNEKGVGIVCLMGINEENGKIGFTTYSTLHNKYFLTEKNEFTLDFEKMEPAPDPEIFKDELAYKKALDFESDTTIDFTEYTTEQKALSGYEADMNGGYLKVNGAVSVPVSLEKDSTYLAHFKLLANESNLNLGFTGENCTVNFRASSKNGTMAAENSLSVTNGDGFLDVYAVISATDATEMQLTLSGEFSIDNLTVVNVNDFAPQMLGATFNPTADPEAKEAMYVTRIDVPSHLTIEKIATYMGVTSELVASGHAYDFDNTLPNVTAAILKSYLGVGYIAQQGEWDAFRSGDVYATFKGADQANQKTKYSVRTVIDISDAYGNELGFSVATNNDGSATENGVYSRSLNQIKRLLAKNLMEASAQNAHLAESMIEYNDSTKLYNGPIEQVWAFILECVNPKGDMIEKPGKFPVIDEEGEDDFI